MFCWEFNMHHFYMFFLWWNCHGFWFCPCYMCCSEACNKDVPVVLIDMHSCSLDSKIRMNLGTFYLIGIFFFDMLKRYINLLRLLFGTCYIASHWSFLLECSQKHRWWERSQNSKSPPRRGIYTVLARILIIDSFEWSISDVVGLEL